jgi:hypothetical protein
MGATVLNHNEFRDYLLGSLGAERRTAVEEQILVDPSVYEELLAAEEELIDQYVHGGLSKAEQHQFETHFLITAERHKNLRFGRLLKRYIDSHRVAVPNQAAVPFHLTSFSRGPAIAVAAGIAACLGLLFLGWHVVRKPTVSTAGQSTSRVMVVSLAPGSTRSAGVTQRVTVPPTGVNLKLELEVTNTSFPNYKSQLLRGSEPLQTNELKMEAKGNHNVVPLTITAEKLSPGEYSVRLCGVSDSGKKAFLDSYSFTVTSE